MRFLCSLFALLIGFTHLPAQSPSVTAKPEVVLETGAHTAGVTDFAFTPDGTQLISISKDKTIRVWDLETTECLKVLRTPAGTGNDGELEAMALSGNGKILAVSGTGYAVGDTRRVPIYIIDLTTDKIVKTLEGHKGTVKVLSISGDGSRLVSSDTRQLVHLWDVSKGTSRYLDAPISRTTDNVQVTLAPDGRHVAAITKNGIVCWNAHTGEETGRTKPNGPVYSQLGWHPDSKRVAGQAYQLKAVDFIDPTGEVEKRLEIKLDIDKAGSGYSNINFSKDGSRFAISWGIYHYTLVDTATGLVAAKLPSHRRSNFVISPDNTRAACNSGSTDSSVSVWNQSTGTWDGALPADDRKDGPTTVLWRPDGKEVRWSRSRNSGYSVGLDFAELRAVVSTKKSLETHTGAIQERDGVRIERAGGGAYRWAVRDIAKDIVLGRWNSVGGNTSQTDAISLLPGGRIAVGRKPSQLQIYNHDGTVVRKLDGHSGTVAWLAPSPDGRYLASTASDNLMKLWDLTRDRSQPLLTVYLQATQHKTKGNYTFSFEWIAWTPEGYYACSADGEKLIAWLTPGGPDQLGTTISPDRFRKQFHRPDVIRRLLELGSLEKALAAADKERGIETPKVAFADATPPQVVLTAPTETAVAKVTVKAKATPVGKYPIQELQLLIDGRPIPTALWKAPDKKLAAIESQWDVELTPGPHRLSVVARTEVSNGLSSFHDITFTDPRAALPSLHVLSIGINSYPGDWKLNCAANDATGIARVFQQQAKGCYREVHVTTLLDAKATRQAILDGLATIKRTMKPQDVAVIFFAGHGVKHKKGPFHLLTADTDFGVEEKSGLSNDDLKKRLAEIPGRILVMLDACHSGASGRLDDLARELSDEDCGVVVMCAAMGREQAGEERKLGHGYFALAVLEGLGGKADASKKDGQIYLHHLDQYVTDRVIELSNDEQHPVSGKPTSVRSFALAKPK